MKRYRKHIESYLGVSILGPLLILTKMAGEIILPKLMSMIINNGVAQRNVQHTLFVGGLMILTTLVMAIGGVGRTYFLMKAAISFTSDLRVDPFSKVQEFSSKNINACSTGSLVTHPTNDIQQAQNVLTMGSRTTICAPGMSIGALLMIFMMSARPAVAILVAIPLLITVIAVMLKAAFPRSTAMQKRLDQLNSDIQEAPTSMRVIRSFVREKFEGGKLRVMNQDLENSSLDAMKIVIAAMPVMTPAMNITTLAVIWYEGNIAVAGDMPVGDLITFTTYIVQIPMSLMMLSIVFLQLSRAVTSICRMSKIMDTEIDLTDQGTARKGLAVLTGKMKFKHVSFSYMDNQDETVLEDANLTVGPGQAIGIIGATDSDKTTLMQMIPQLYDAARDQALVDGMDVRDYPPRGLREGVGVVLQKNVPLSGTIEENLRWGREDISTDEVREMTQGTQADGFVTFFTSGYDMGMGQGGVNISGSQKQRLCIVGALLKRPRVLILDSSASAVDTTTEARTRQRFSTSLKDTTKIIIAQCIGSMEEADRTLVLDEGRLTGQGTYRWLTEECQVYQEIYYSQRSRKETAAS